jgi:hypothetical protein
MIYNHILDCLRGRVSPPDWRFFGDRREAARYMKEAEVFDFGEVPMEKVREEVYRPPQLTDEEEGFFAEGLLPLPAPTCWYDLSVDGGCTGLLVKEFPNKPGDLFVMRIDKRTGSMGEFVRLVNIKGVAGVALYHERQDVINWIQDHEMEYSMASAVMVAKYLTLMINSRSTERNRVPAQRTAEQVAHNRHGSPDHTVVTIVPKKWITEDSVHQGGHHASPRLHWRRTHVRRYRAPSGEVYKSVIIPRMLVGRAELGTVTHTYKVKI